MIAIPASPLAALTLAMALDAWLGEPDWLYRRVPHPVILIGRLIARAEAKLNRENAAASRRRVLGAVLVALLALGGAAIGCLIERLLLASPLGWIALAVVMSVFIAGKSLRQHVAAVAAALRRDGVAGGRQAVAKIVGRDPESLDAAAIARAAIESLAENFADGVVAPVFWGALLGLPGMIAYKAINTADSMIGHRSPRYRAFGWAAARLDDLVNLAPARIAGLLLALAAAIPPRGDPRAAWRAMRRDAPGHRSPNAGWPEAAMAGALGFALNGPRRYGGVASRDGWMNEGGRANLGPADIERALLLYRRAAALLFAAVAAALAVSAH